MIVNKPMVTRTSLLSHSSRLAIGPHMGFLRLSSADRATALASTIMNGSESIVLSSGVFIRSVENARSLPTDPKSVRRLLKMLLARTRGRIISPLASRKVSRYSNTYFKSISQKPFLKGFGFLSTMIILLTLR
jgi:hypothetical protein